MPFHCVFPNHYPCQLLLKLVTVISSWERRGGCEHPSEEEVRKQRAGKCGPGSPRLPLAEWPMPE